MVRVPQSFKTIVLDNLPFLTVELFELMVNTMPNLKAVTITRCVSLDVTKLKPLLEVIKRHPRIVQNSTPDPSGSTPGASGGACEPSSSNSDPSSSTDEPSTSFGTSTSSGPSASSSDTSASSSDPSASSSDPGTKASNKQQSAETEEAEPEETVKEYISLDFGPFFFRGSYSADRRGCYGVTHNEPIFHTPKSVFALILQCWPLAQEVGMDLVSDSSSFWSFVRQLPGPDALWAIKAREALLTREFDLATMPPDTDSDSILIKFADDLTAAVTGDNHRHPKAPVNMARFLPSEWEREGQYWRHSVICLECHTSLPLSLFPIRAAACWSCKMSQYVDKMEDSHLRLWIESTMTKWLDNMNTKEGGLSDLLSWSVSLTKAYEDAKCADWVREYYLFSWKPAQVPVSDPVTGWVTQPPPSYSPPAPETLSVDRVSMARWRAQQEPTEAFDYRHGGPQRESPCKDPITTTSESFSAEESEHFARRWQWTPGKTDETFREVWNEEWRPAPNRNRREELEAALRKARWRLSDRMKRKLIAREHHLDGKIDRHTYLCHHHFVEDCRFSLGTPGKVVFCKDKPVPDQGVDREAYRALVMRHHWASSPYGHVPTGFW